MRTEDFGECLVHPRSHPRQASADIDRRTLGDPGTNLFGFPAQTILQERSPDWIKGRVLAVQYLILYAATVVYVPIVGWLADHAGLSATLLIVSATVAAAGSLTIYLRIRAEKRDGGRITRRGGARSSLPEGHL